MRKLWILSIVTLTLLVVGCGSEEPSVADSLAGTWQGSMGSLETRLEFTASQEWKYFRDGRLTEEGVYEIDGSRMIIKHKAGGHGDGATAHAHDPASDHVYEFALVGDDRLELKMGGEISVYTRAE